MTRAISVLGVVALLVEIALAQPKPVPPPSTEPADVAYREGRRLYDLREFAQAIVKFKEAYRIREDAASLFNIAQSYRLLDDCPNAHAYYTTFSRNYPAERVEVVQKFIAELAPCAKAKPTTTPPTTEPGPKPPTTTPPVTEPTRPVAPPVAESPASPGRTLRISGIAVAGVGAIALGTGVYFGLSARSQSKDLDSAPVWDPDLQDGAKRADRNAKITFVVGGAALVGGAVLLYLGMRAGDESSSVALVPVDGGSSIVWWGAF